MYQIDRILEQLDELSSLELLAEVFTDIARARLDRVRAGIEKNRIFVAEIAKILHVVRVSAEAQGLSASRRKKISASLLLTSNKRLYYGNLDTKVVDFYIAHTQYTGYVDRFVVGSVGIDILEGRSYPFPFEQLVFSGDLPNLTELAGLTAKLNDYQKVIVYYPRFMSVLTQQPSFVDITGLVASTPETEDEKYYLFEPEIGKILDFFENQVMMILVEQTMLESELARIGTQLTSMDDAQQRATKLIGQENNLLAGAKRQLLNIKALEAATMMRKRKRLFAERYYD